MPLERLGGNLTAQTSQALCALGRTDHVAATALSLHTNHPPTWFDCWRCHDVAEDGSTIRGRGPHMHTSRPYGGGPDNDTAPCMTPITVPWQARQLIAAHLLYRRSQGATGTDRFFVDITQPDRSPAKILLSRASATCRRLNPDPPWLHGHDCRYADVGLAHRTFGWLEERGLSLHPLRGRLIWPTTIPGPQ